MPHSDATSGFKLPTGALPSSSAGTPITEFDGNLSTVEFLNYDITTVGYQLRPPDRVAIVGGGGGRDILSALLAGANDIDAIGAKIATASDANAAARACDSNITACACCNSFAVFELDPNVFARDCAIFSSAA